MDTWVRFNETSLPEKKGFYSNLTIENIINADYKHAKRVGSFGIQNVDQYHDLYMQSDTLPLADVFERFQNKCIQIINLIQITFISTYTGIAGISEKNKSLENNRMINIIFNYIFGLTYSLWKWTLESKSKYIVENNIYHPIIFRKCICFC